MSFTASNKRRILIVLFVLCTPSIILLYRSRIPCDVFGTACATNYDSSHMLPLISMPKFGEHRYNRLVHLIDTDSTQISGKVLCCMESISRLMPDWLVVLHAANFKPNVTISGKTAEVLSKLPNATIIPVNVVETITGTPLDKTKPVQELMKKNFAKTHGAIISDVLRLGLLYKLGGVYLDTDTIAMNRLDVADNFVIRHTPSGGIINGFLGAKRGSGWISTYARDSGNRLNPKFLTSLMGAVKHGVAAYCKETGTKQPASSMEDYNCKDLTVFGQKHPLMEPIIQKKNASAMFAEHTTWNQELIKHNPYVFIHYGSSSWNKGKKGQALPVKTGTSIYAFYAQQYCPITVETFQDF